MRSHHSHDELCYMYLNIMVKMKKACKQLIQVITPMYVYKNKDIANLKMLHEF